MLRHCIIGRIDPQSGGDGCFADAPGKANRQQSRPGLRMPLELDAILFESDDVLYDASAWWRWLTRLLTAHGVHTNHDTLSEIWKRDYLPSTRLGCGRWQAMRRLLSCIGIGKPSIQEIELAARPKWREFESGLRLLPGVLEVISQLNTWQVKLGVMNESGRSGSELQDCLSHLCLAGCFSFQATMDQLTPPRSERSLLNFAANHLGGKSQVVAIVGKDRPTLETAGQMGWFTISCQGWPDQSADVWIPHVDLLARVVRPRSHARQAA